MTSHAGYSLTERCKLFHRKYPEVKLSVSHLQRLYQKHNIKFKVIRQQKLVSKIPTDKLNLMTQTMHVLVTQAIEDEVKIVFTDEAIFSPKTRLERTLAARLTNFK